MDLIKYKCDVSIIDHYDVVICGGGPAGCAAALAAARNGAKTILIEAQGQLGGMATSGLVSHWLGGRSADCRKWIVGGIFKELSERAFRESAALIPQVEKGEFSPHGWNWENGALTAGVPVDPFRMSALLDELMENAKVEVLLLTQFVDAVIENNMIKELIIFNKSGLAAVSANVFIDATGDADVAFKSGCDVQKGRKNDNLMAPATVMMQVSGVDTREFSGYIHANKTPRLIREIKEWAEAGDWDFDYDRFISVQLCRQDEYMINTSRICGIDGTDGKSLSELMRKGRRENLKLLDIMRRRIPGFQNVRLKAMASLPGIRETRRIISNYVLTVDDIRKSRKFDDIIGFSAYGWDLPDPERPSVQPMDGEVIGGTPNKIPIPFRIMLPRPINNLICPGRAVSVERDVLGPLRVMAPCMAMGQAAGTAAAQTVAKQSTFSEINIGLLQSVLQVQGAFLH